MRFLIRIGVSAAVQRGDLVGEDEFACRSWLVRSLPFRLPRILHNGAVLMATFAEQADAVSVSGLGYHSPKAQVGSARDRA